MINIAHLTKYFDDQLVLDDINLKIQDGEILVILGQSGAGKSVLLKSLMGLLKPDKGCIEINLIDITRLDEPELLKVRKNIGYLFQEGALYDFMTAFENVAFPLKEHTKLSEEEIANRVRETLSFVDLEGIEEKYPSELSGGMKKRLGLARSIILNSKTLFCDEPTSGLDPMRSRDISNLIKSISDRFQCTIVATSHDIPNSFRIADRLALIQDGKIIAVGTKKELEASNQPFVQEFIKL